MLTLGLLAGVLLLLLGISDLSFQQRTLQRSQAAEFTGTIAELHCRTERKQPAVKLRLTTHPPSVWFHSNRDLLGQFQPCNVLQSAMDNKATLSLLTANSQIIGLRIDNQQIYQPADWRQHQLNNALGLSLCGLILCFVGFYGWYRRYCSSKITAIADRDSRSQ